MPKPSKRFRANAEHVDAAKRYAITEAFTTLKKFKVAKFDESVDVAWRRADALPPMSPGMTARVRAALERPGDVGIHRGPLT